MARNNVGIMPIHAASLGGHTSMGKLLLENGVNPRHLLPRPESHGMSGMVTVYLPKPNPRVFRDHHRQSTLPSLLILAFA
jgi:hypothetical protein